MMCEEKITAAERMFRGGFFPDQFFLSPRREDAKNTKVMASMTEDEIGRQTVDGAVQIHRAVGPGLLESVYEVILAHELRGKGLKFDEGFRADLLGESKVIVELKCV